MTTQRKVRKDFDATKEYSVNVQGCAEDVKKAVQQAFFDAGFLWLIGGKEYQHLDAVQYSNARGCGDVTEHCMCGSTTKECNMTAEAFLDLVYEPEQQGYVHAKLMLQFAEDAQTHAEPWKLWQFKVEDDAWRDCPRNPHWRVTTEYRRKPKTHIVNGVEIPDLRVTPKYGDDYYLADSLSITFFNAHNFVEHRMEKLWVERGLCYQRTEEGKQAAILHSKAMLGIICES